MYRIFQYMRWSKMELNQWRNTTWSSASWVTPLHRKQEKAYVQLLSWTERWAHDCLEAHFAQGSKEHSLFPSCGISTCYKVIHFGNSVLLCLMEPGILLFSGTTCNIQNTEWHW